MIRITLFSALLACALVAPAFAASSAAGSAASCVGSMASSHTTSGDNSKENKVVLQARDDAASFVASDGRIRGARLEAALRHLREQNLNARVASDMQLAQAIVAY
jgi:uncharacterized protein (TIGR02448 family)